MRLMRKDSEITEYILSKLLRAGDFALPIHDSYRVGTTFFGSDARNNTIQTQRKTMSLNKNSPVRFHAIGSVDMLHLTTPGVEKKNDHVVANLPIPISEPSADRIGINAPAARIAAVVNSIMPSR